MHFGAHHQSLRRRLGLVSKRRLVRNLDIVIYLTSAGSFLFTLDQARLIWVEHNAAGVSVMMWGFYVYSAFVWMLYGRIHRDNIIVVLNALWMVVNFVIALGAYIYR